MLFCFLFSSIFYFYFYFFLSGFSVAKSGCNKVGALDVAALIDETTRSPKSDPPFIFAEKPWRISQRPVEWQLLLG
ncbi:hypothetical protein BDV28DRAFT_133593 [Aspergillus coremiiformis]|uniref:Uncharacterized protein n=1 Tax=Aspergillus coremiiformis TaxID=138285 RepID=A0A5N6ZAT0_9EURO|nr:hypothetical protein BDV28DRAFT_133593 [Aspergillus coremiiformis]